VGAPSFHSFFVGHPSAQREDLRLPLFVLTIILNPRCPILAAASSPQGGLSHQATALLPNLKPYPINPTIPVKQKSTNPLRIKDIQMGKTTRQPAKMHTDKQKPRDPLTGLSRLE
jgi:hypothetical protein